MKINLKILISALFVLGLTALVFFTVKPKIALSDAELFSNDYKSVSEDNIFVYKNINEIINILEHGSGIVYLGFPECPWCQAYVPMLNNVAKEKTMSKIYYFNILEERKNNTNNYKKIVEILKEYLEYDDEGNKRIYVPAVITVNNGTIVGFDDETSVISGDITPEDYWSVEKKELLKNKLNIMIDAITDRTCITCDK